MRKRFSPRVFEAIAATKYLKIRCGPEHRFIAVWCVGVDGRILARSWNDAPDGWRKAFLEHPQGEVQLDGRSIAIRVVPLRSEAVNAKADAAYGKKYTTAANRPYVKGLLEPGRKATTMELLPT